MVRFRCRLRTVVLTALIMGSPWFQVALADLNDGLVAYYPFNENANDESLNGLDGIVNGATLTEDRFGNPDSAYYFDGNDSIKIPNFTLDPDEDFTFSLWVVPNGFTKTANLFNKESVYELAIFAKDCSLRQCDNDEVIRRQEFAFAVRKDWDWYSMNYAANNNETYLVTMVYDSTNHRVLSYINGMQTSLDDLNQSGSSVQNNFLCLGSRGNCNSAYFTGVLDDIRIYNRALSEDEVQTLYQEDDGDCKHAAYSLKKRTLTVPFVEMPVIDFFTGQSTGEVELWTGTLKQVLGVTNRFRLLSKTVVPITDGSSSSCPATYAVETGTLSIPYIDIPTGIAVGNKNFENGVNVFRAIMTWEPMGKSFVVQEVQKLD